MAIIASAIFGRSTFTFGRIRIIRFISSEERCPLNMIYKHALDDLVQKQNKDDHHDGNPLSAPDQNIGKAGTIVSSPKPVPRAELVINTEIVRRGELVVHGGTIKRAELVQPRH